MQVTINNAGHFTNQGIWSVNLYSSDLDENETPIVLPISFDVNGVCNQGINPIEMNQISYASVEVNTECGTIFKQILP